MPLVDHPLALEEPQEMVETLGRFRKIPRTIPLEPGDVALQDGFIHLTQGIALPLQPPAERIIGAHIALDTAPSIALLMEEGSRVVQVRSQRTTPQLGDHVRPDKDVFEPASLLFPSGDFLSFHHHASWRTGRASSQTCLLCDSRRA
jgi:hypothetical protein